MATIQDGKVVLYHFSLFGEDGKLIETSRDEEAEVYLHGAEDLPLPALEAALSGRKPGDKFEVKLAPDDAYGWPRGAAAERVISRDDIEDEIETGDPVIDTDEDGEETELWVKSIQGERVVLTADHPLAGQTIRFELEVLDVRDANEDELAEGIPFGWSGDEPPEDDEEWDGVDDEDEA